MSEQSNTYRPIFWYGIEDKKDYESYASIQHSKCYTEYGLKRTGCAGCPFGRDFEFELEVLKTHEPMLYKAANNIFKDSYEYTRRYKAFKEAKEQNSKRIVFGNQLTIFDFIGDTDDSRLSTKKDQ